MPGVVIAGTHSGCGKTTITLGVLSALKKKGMAVQSFKAGPDFIDAGLHRMITGRPSRNLDLWMCGEDYVRSCFYNYSKNVDISVIEGVMGMYDGNYNTARLSKVLGAPVILVVDAYGMAESAGAMVKGFREYESNNIAGVIFNRVASERHFEKLKGLEIDVLGYLPRDLDFKIPSRHLGLITAEEEPLTARAIEKLSEVFLRHVDINKLISLAKDNRDGCPTYPIIQLTNHPINKSTNPQIRIAVAYDKAFCFYYEDNLDLLKDAGAEIITFSPLADKKIPDGADAVYIGGGYPELYAKELSGNISMLKSIKKWSDAGRPIYAECGGLMYLSKGIYDLVENFFAMADILPFETRMKKDRASLGYREIELSDDCILGKKGEKLRGHEFHYSEIKNSATSEGTVPDLRTERSGVVESGLSLSVIDKVYSVRNNRGEFVAVSGYKFKNTLASYVHVHFGSNSGIAQNFINFIMQEN